MRPSVRSPQSAFAHKRAVYHRKHAVRLRVAACECAQAGPWQEPVRPDCAARATATVAASLLSICLFSGMVSLRANVLLLSFFLSRQEILRSRGVPTMGDAGKVSAVSRPL